MNIFEPTTAMIVALLVSPIIPLLSALLSRAHWPQEVTGIITIILATANGFFTEWAQAGSSFKWQVAFTASILSFILALAGRYGLWKGTKTDAKALAIGSRTAPAAPPAENHCPPAGNH